MNDEEYKEFIRETFIKENGFLNNARCSSRWLSSRQSISAELNQRTDFLECKTPIGVRVHTIISGVYTTPICVECETPTTFDRDVNCWRKFCSAACSNRSDSTKAKTRQTCLKKYGTEYAAQSKKFKEKNQQTCLKKYGVKNAMQSATIRNKVVQTKAAHTPAQKQAFRDKRRQTCLEKYGVECASQTKATQDKIEQTCLDRYGVRRPMQSKKFKEKNQQTCLDRYGVKFALQSKTVRIKSIQTSLDNGVYLGWALRGDEIRALVKTGCSAQDLANMLGFATTSPIYLSVLPHFGLTSEDLTNPYASSSPENSLLDYVQALNVCVVSNSRSIIPPKEIDIFVPDMNIGIEFNGSYWHSSKFTTTNYHKEKTELAETQGVHLIHIYEWEWDQKPEKVKQLLDGLFVDRETIGARKTSVHIPTKAEAKLFFNQHHFDGHRGASEYYGLQHNGEWVMMASFTKGELIRLASTKRVLGGLNKILNATDYDEVISYANRSRTNRNHNIYLSCGFKEVRTTKPNYVYVKSGKKLSRHQAMKHKLPKLLGADKFDINNTEVENMRANNWLQIHDSGQLVYTWKRPNKRKSKIVPDSKS